jgi:serine phosphatase RsbU (regulator of sigma subunit)/CHASE3 domain sensor protein
MAFSASRWRWRSLTSRVLTAASLLAVLVIVAGALLTRTAFDLRDAQRRQVNQLAAAQDNAATLLGLFVDEESGLRGYLIGGRSLFLEPLYQARTRIPPTLTVLRGQIAGTPAPASGPAATQALDQVVAAHQRWQAYAAQQIDTVAEGHLAEAQAVANSTAGKQLFDQLRLRMGTLDGAIADAGRRNLAHVEELQQRLIGLLIAALAALAFGVAGSVAILLGMVVAPLGRIATTARTVADGGKVRAIPTSGPSEIRALGSDLDAMRTRLEAELDRTRHAMEALEQHGPAVVALRSALEPTVASIPDLVVAGRLDPAEGVLAGDWYDLALVNDHTLAVVLGDVAGHGPTSAVFALRLKHALTAALRGGARPSDALEHTARGLADASDEMFATVLVAIIDTQANRVAYASAGHPAALLLNRSPSAREPLLARERERVLRADETATLSWIDLPATGPLLTPMVASWSWATAEHDFRADDTLLAFTDGLIEARDSDGEQFGVSRVVEIAREADLADPRGLLDSLAEASNAHLRGARAQDDRTLVCCHRRRVLVGSQTVVPV